MATEPESGQIRPSAPPPRSSKRTTPKPPPRTRPKIGERDAEGDKVRSADDRKLQTELTGIYQGIGVGIGGIGVGKRDEGLAATGAMVVTNAEAAAAAWLDYADQNPAVKRALKRFTEASAIGSLVAVHVAMLAPLLVDRGVIPAAAVGVADAMFTTSNGSSGND